MKFRTWLEAAEVRWQKPNMQDEYAELFGRGVELLHGGEFNFIDTSLHSVSIPKEIESLYKQMSGVPIFRQYAQGQSNAANCLAGQAMQMAAEHGQLRIVSWPVIHNASPEDLDFYEIHQEIDREPDEASRLAKANEISNRTTIEGETRDLTSIADAMKRGASFPAPAIYRGQRSLLVGGKTRILTCMALETVPQVWLITEDAVKRAVEELLPVYQAG